MELLLDTANVEDIKEYCALYEITGVTTNPTILLREKRGFFQIYDDIKNIIGNKQLHVQVTGDKWTEMVKEAECITKYIDKNIYIKVPANEQGVKTMKELKQKGMNVTATAIYMPQQALMAASVGVDYVAPYFNRMSNLNIDSKAAIADISHLFKIQNLSTKILAASFKNTQQIMDSYMAGAHAVTASVDLLKQMFFNPIITSAVQTFKTDWISAYGDKCIYELNIDC